MKARLEGNRITVEFVKANGPEPRLVKGGRWRSGTKLWSYPLTVAKCQEMRRVWGKALSVHVDLSAWYRAQHDEADQQAQRALVDDVRHLPNLSRVAPELFAWVGPDQRVAAHWIAHAYRGAGLLADEPGLGKTYSVVAGLYELNPDGPILIVCPKVSVRTVWARHLSGAPWPVYAARGTRQQREATIADFLADQSRTKVLIVVAEMLRAQGTREKVAGGKGSRFRVSGFEYPELFELTWTAVVLDESHKMLGALTITKGNLMSEGLRRLDIAPAPLGLRLAVTGTPFGDGGKVEGMFGTLHWCWPDEYTSFWRWAEDNFEVTDDIIYLRGGARQKIRKVGKLRHQSEEAFFKALGPRILRRTLEEVSLDHKGLRSYEEVVCEMTDLQRKQYQEFVLNGEVSVDGGIITAIGTLAEMTRARQLANGVLRREEAPEVYRDEEQGRVSYTGESGKLDTVMQRLEDMDLLGKPNPKRRKVVIASQWNEYLKALCKRLDESGTPYHLMTGSTGDTKRERMMDEFQLNDDGPRLFIMNARAGGVSITLDAADFLFQLDEMHPPEANEQLHRRIFRRSRVHAARVVYFRSEDSIDMTIAGDVAVKLAEQLKVLDARRGLNTVRELLRTTSDGRRPYLGSTKARKCPQCGARRNMFHEPGCEVL
jgi:SNF2 family DNA or RNA helicase